MNDTGNQNNKTKYCLKGQSDLLNECLGMNKPPKQKASVPKAILFFVPSLLIFSITRIIISLVIALVLYAFSLVPILENILSSHFFSRGDSPMEFSIYIGTFFAYLIISFAQSKMIKNVLTKELSRKILGIVIIVFHVLFLILRIMAGSNVLANIICIIFGIVFIAKK